ncbi:MAG: helix-turn-helix transcriptional regulator [Flavobacterium sp.]
MKKIPVRHIDTTSKKKGSFQNFSIRNLTDLLSGKDMVQPLHRHDFFYILILEKGMGFHNIDFVNYEIKDNTIFFVRPGQVHRLELYAASTGYLIKFNTDFCHYVSLRKASSQNYYSLDGNKFQRILSASNYIFDEFKNKRENYFEIITANLSLFFTELIREQNKSGLENKNLYTQERLDEFTALLETQIFAHKQVSDYAGMLNLTPYQLNSITKTSLNKTASELITEAIILESKRYLLATTNQVNQIAGYMGYEDVSYFIRFFKKHTGFSPETFRKNFR